MDVGLPGTFDAQWAGLDTVVVRAAGPYQAWYWAADASSRWSIGYAESDDGFSSWTKHPGPVVDSGWSPEVLFDGQLYSMWYSVGGPSAADISYAVSPDGVEWTPYIGNPVIQEAGLPAVLYERISIHGTYWHDGFGYRHSHGCVNISLTDSFWVFQWSAEGGYEKPYVHVWASGVY